MEQGLTVEQMRIKGRTASRGRMLAAMEAQEWPEGASRRVVVVRQLEVSGRWWEIPARAVHLSRQKVQAAVPADAPSADSAPAVFFESAGELLAAQCRDILSGTVERWFWASWPAMRRERPAALQSLLLESVQWLPEALGRLSAQGLAGVLLRSLPDDTLDRLVDQVAARFGRSFRPPAVQGAGVVTQARSSATPLIERLQRALEPWQPMLTSLPAPQYEAGARLIVVVVAWQVAPALLCRTDAAGLIDALLLEALAPSDVEAESPLPAPPVSARSEASRENATVGVATGATSTGGSAAAAGRGHGTPGSGPPRGISIAASAGESDVAISKAEPATAMRRSTASAPSVNATTDEAPFAAWQFLTLTGRGFLLLNTLRAAGLGERLTRGELDGWGCLWRVLDGLGLRVDRAMQSFLADRLGLADAEALDSIAPLPDERAVLDGLQRRFAAHRIWQDPEWTCAPARVLASPAHLDLHFDTSAVRDDIRLAGLDVDPGWLPWLGTVVRVHYDIFPELRAVHTQEAGNE